jgi:glutaminase
LRRSDNPASAPLKLRLPVPTPILKHLQSLHDTFASLDDGAVATYIPELGRADPSWFGIAIATVDGVVYEVGDSRQEFTIQSISKPFAYGLALEHHGLKRVSRRVGVEPSGDAFNSISLDPRSGRPLNPMINAGAIATTSFVPGDSKEKRERAMLGFFEAFAGRDLSVDDAVYRSERDTGHRNRAIAHLLRNADVLEGDPEEPLDLYFRQCSIAVTCSDLARMAACLAAGGIQPATGERVLSTHNVGRVLSIMSSCGMYDFAGEWIFEVGMPAKSGVAGGILAVLPGQLGIGVFSPPLDERGNSVRGIRVCKALSREFGLHLFNSPRVVLPALRASCSGADVHSKRRRPLRELEALARVGGKIRLFELHGRLELSSVEMATRTILRESADASHVIIDLERVFDLDAAACRLLVDLRDQLERDGKRAFLACIHEKDTLRAYVDGHRSVGDWEVLDRYPTRDEALDLCENEVLVQAGVRPAELPPATLAEQELCRGFTETEIAALEARLRPARWDAGDTVMAQGSAADWLLFISHGEVGVFLNNSQGGETLLTRLGPGSSVGELALPDRQPRAGTIRALTQLEGGILDFAAFDRLPEEGLVQLQLKLLTNLAAVLAARLRTAAREIRSLT